MLVEQDGLWPNASFWRTIQNTLFKRLEAETLWLALAQGGTVRRSLLISIGDANIDLYSDTVAVVSDTATE